MNFKEELAKRTEEAERIIVEYLPLAGDYDKEIIEAMNYSVSAGGKRLRPVLMMSAYRLFGGDGVSVKPFMAAMEMLHTYSLVHDDLPALDNDDYRRGMLTTHKKFGEAAAVLCGDALLHQSYETAMKAFDAEQSERVIRAFRIFGNKSGIYGMIGGQSADVIHTGEMISDGLLYYIYEKKTGALIEGSLMIGAALAGASQADIDKMQKAGAAIGMAFQIQDDVLDLEGNEALLGKPVNSDERNGKKTYITIHGMDKAKSDIRYFSEEAVKIISETGNNTCEREFLNNLIRHLAERVK